LAGASVKGAQKSPTNHAHSPAFLVRSAKLNEMQIRRALHKYVPVNGMSRKMGLIPIMKLFVLHSFS
jgi:hypothetical protein